MEIAEGVRRTLMRAGASSLQFNAPMSEGRANDIARFAAGLGTSVIDLGCGYGSLAVKIAERHSGIHVLGIDSDVETIERAKALAVERSLSDRVRFEIGHLPQATESADVAICIGASHAFGGTVEMFRELYRIGAVGAVVGDGIWIQEPGSENLDRFGPLFHGVEGLVQLATTAGWTVWKATTSTIEEWDDFEAGWCEGVRQSGTDEAAAFADHRWDMYLTYRGVLGFGWIYVHKGN